MERRKWQRLGLIGLVLMVLFYFWTRQRQAKRARQIPPDDRVV